LTPFQKLGIIYYLLPFIDVIDNRIGLLFSILIGRKKMHLKVKGHGINFDASKFQVMMAFMGVLMYCTSFKITSDRKIELTLDLRNTFSIPLDNMSYEDQNLIETLFEGSRYGANFETSDINFIDYRDKTLVITEQNGKKIIETSKGVKFYIDSIHPGNTIGEAFVMDIHTIRNQNDYTNKIVVDVGAECGDTPLYYASRGAKVYAFEPMKAHFDAMIRNLSLNPELAKRIIPINAAIGKDGMLKFYHSDQADIAGVSSFVYNAHGDDVIVFDDVQGYSLSSALVKFDIPHVDILKLDCKGCEFFIKQKDLEKVEQVKIEYEAFEYTKHNLNELTKVLDDSGFEYMIYRYNPTRDRFSNLVCGHLFGKKTNF
jgi:FkbM family methyltransferase